MTTFQKNNIYFQLKHTNLNFFAHINAKHDENVNNYTKQLNNIRIKPLKLSKNIIISNIFSKQKDDLKFLKKPILINNLVTLYLLINLKKPNHLNVFLTKYFNIAKETLNLTWSFYLTNKFSFSYKKITSSCLENLYLINKISEISYYQYNNVILNKHRVNYLFNNQVLITSFWMNNSSPNKFSTNTTINKKISYNYLTNRNTYGFKTNLLSPLNMLNLNANKGTIIKNINNYFLYRPFENYLKIPNNYLYILTRIEEKIEILEKGQNNTVIVKKLINFYNFLLYLILRRNQTTITRDFLLGNVDFLNKSKNINIEFFITKTLNNLVQNKKNTEITNFYQRIKLKMHNKTPFKANFTLSNINKYYQNPRLKIYKAFTHKKLELTSQYSKAVYNKNILSTILKQNTKIFYINALALTKFGFLLEKKGVSNQSLSANPNKFLNNLDREMISKYKYVGVYIKDLIRVAFIALFLKKPAFLAKFIAFQLNVLPKNRKETTFIRFIIKLVKTFAAEREEIWGLRLKFKGRVNRWRRTKVILGQRGILPLHTMRNRIEYGSAQGVNRKGAVGVHIWIWYNPGFKTLLRNTYKKYFVYSKYLNSKKQIND